MALIKNHKKTEENRSARRRNGRQSQGATTPEGKERSRAANLKHGYYSELRDEALVALGEDPAALKALIAGAHEQFEPANAMQASMAEHLAHLHWRMLRAERLQESSLLQRIQHEEDRRRQQAEQCRYSYLDLHEFLETTREAVGRPDFCALPGFIQACTVATKKSNCSRMGEILHLLYRLRPPQRFSDPPPPPMPESMDDESWALGPELFGPADEPCPANPKIAVAEGEERDELRQELRNLLETQISVNKETWEKTIIELEAPLPVLERDQMAAVAMKENALMRRDESSCSREFWRTANMLIKFQAGKEQNKSEVKQEPKVRNPRSNVKRGSAVPSPISEDSSPSPDVLPPDSCLLTPSSENAGASGDIHENKGGLKMNSVRKQQVRGVYAPAPSDKTFLITDKFVPVETATVKDEPETLPKVA